MYKVETVGDSYMIVSGAPEKREDHCEMVCNVALGMVWEAKQVDEPITRKPVQVLDYIQSGIPSVYSA